MWLQDVSAKTAMDVAKATALSATGLTEAGLKQSFPALTAEYTRRALKLLEALALVRLDGSRWVFSGDSRLRTAHRDQLPVFFAQSIQRYAPFISYAHLLSQGYSPDEAAAIVGGVFEIQRQPDTVRKVLTSWGRYADLLTHDGVSPVVEPLTKDRLSVINKLIEAVRSEFQANMFVAGELGNELTASLASIGIGPDEIGKGLADHQRRPQEAVTGPSKAVEQYLSSLQAGSPGPLTNIAQIADSLLAQKKILRTHKNLAYGVAGFRNASDHSPDPDTGVKWSVSSDAALVGTLLALLTLKSIHAYISMGEQAL